ncbi:hypothetical protein F-S17_0072 [Faustovirus]|nr:hypothetical protein F-LCD7_0087 [Faustovirus]QJX71850.1 hypothetical protein F-M6_0087 [Faustovirus]QJX72338.1 hypothetical protein F-S17_0072 [Faustovirus]QJX73862.1 hypothetical protein F-E9_89 [Faustovirus]
MEGQQENEPKSLNDILKSYYLAHINNSRYQFENREQEKSENTNNQLYIAQPGKAIHVITEDELERITGVNPIYCAYHDPTKLHKLWPKLRIIRANGIWYIGNDDSAGASDHVDLVGCVARYCRGEPLGGSGNVTPLTPTEIYRLRDLLTEYSLDSLIPELDRSCRANSYYCNIL